MLDRRFDGALVAGPVRNRELEEEAIFQEELVVVTAPSVHGLDDLAHASSLKIVVFRAGCSYRQRLEAILAERGAICLKGLEFGTVAGILGCVGAGIGVTLLPRSVVESSWQKGAVAIHELPREESCVDTVFVRRRDAYVSSALAAFLRCARSLGSATLRSAEARPGLVSTQRQSSPL